MKSNQLTHILNTIRRNRRLWGKMTLVALTLVALLFAGISLRPSAVKAQTITQGPADTDVKISVSQSYVETIVADAVKDQARLSNVKVDLVEPNRALVSADMQVLGNIAVRPTAVVEFRVVDHQVDIQINEIQMSTFSLSTSLVQNQVDTLTNQLEMEVNQVVDAMNETMGLELTNVSVTDSHLIIDMNAATPNAATATPSGSSGFIVSTTATPAPSGQ